MRQRRSLSVKAALYSSCVLNLYAGPLTIELHREPYLVSKVNYGHQKSDIQGSRLLSFLWEASGPALCYLFETWLIIVLSDS